MLIKDGERLIERLLILIRYNNSAWISGREVGKGSKSGIKLLRRGYPRKVDGKEICDSHYLRDKGRGVGIFAEFL